MAKFTKLKWLALASAAGALSMPALAQALAQPVPPPAQAQPQQTTKPAASDPIAPLPQSAAEAAPEELPPPIWTMANANELLTYINSIYQEGLNPAD